METTDKMQKKIEQGREYRLITSVVAPTDDEKMVVEGYATTFNEPYHLYDTYNNMGAECEVKEQVDRHAFDRTDFGDCIMQYDREGVVFARLSNKTLELDVDDKGLKVRAFLGGTSNGRNLYEEIKGGYITKMSFGFTVAENGSKIEPDGNDQLRTIYDIKKLYDVSAVSIPANDFTEISARNHIDGAIDEIETERIRLEEERKALEEKKENLVERLKALKESKDEN